MHPGDGGIMTSRASLPDMSFDPARAGQPIIAIVSGGDIPPALLHQQREQFNSIASHPSAGSEFFGGHAQIQEMGNPVGMAPMLDSMAMMPPRSLEPPMSLPPPALPNIALALPPDKRQLLERLVLNKSLLPDDVVLPLLRVVTPMPIAEFQLVVQRFETLPHTINTDRGALFITACTLSHCLHNEKAVLDHLMGDSLAPPYVQGVPGQPVQQQPLLMGPAVNAYVSMLQAAGQPVPPVLAAIPNAGLPLAPHLIPQAAMHAPPLGNNVLPSNGLGQLVGAAAGAVGDGDDPMLRSPQQSQQPKRMERAQPALPPGVVRWRGRPAPTGVAPKMVQGRHLIPVKVERGTHGSEAGSRHRTHESRQQGRRDESPKQTAREERSKTERTQRDGDSRRREEERRKSGGSTREFEKDGKTTTRSASDRGDERSRKTDEPSKGRGKANQDKAHERTEKQEVDNRSRALNQDSKESAGSKGKGAGRTATAETPDAKSKEVLVRGRVRERDRDMEQEENGTAATGAGGDLGQNEEDATLQASKRQRVVWNPPSMPPASDRQADKDGATQRDKATDNGTTRRNSVGRSKEGARERDRDRSPEPGSTADEAGHGPRSNTGGRRSETDQQGKNHKAGDKRPSGKSTGPSARIVHRSRRSRSPRRASPSARRSLSHSRLPGRVVHSSPVRSRSAVRAGGSRKEQGRHTDHSPARSRGADTAYHRNRRDTHATEPYPEDTPLEGEEYVYQWVDDNGVVQYLTGANLEGKMLYQTADGQVVAVDAYDDLYAEGVEYDGTDPVMADGVLYDDEVLYNNVYTDEDGNVYTYADADYENQAGAYDDVQYDQDRDADDRDTRSRRYSRDSSRRREESSRGHRSERDRSPERYRDLRDKIRAQRERRGEVNPAREDDKRKNGSSEPSNRERPIERDRHKTIYSRLRGLPIDKLPGWLRRKVLQIVEEHPQVKVDDFDEQLVQDMKGLTNQQANSIIAQLGQKSLDGVHHMPAYLQSLVAKALKDGLQ